MIERGATLPVTRQVEILGLSRSSVYYEAIPVSDLDLALMRRIDEIHLEPRRALENRPPVGTSK
jgi:putative transposase